eukprot:m.399599 g.399599  ORF g.399599 m.399599 type:complete len:318 (-) comp21151_c1_seq7:151-1104(-)
MAPVLKGMAAAMITPFTADNKVNVECIPKMVEMFIDAGHKATYLCGSTGSGFACTMEERKTMTAAVCDAVKGRIAVIVMVGACPVDEAVQLAIHAKEVGASAISSTVPGAYSAMFGEERKPNLAESIEYFKTVGGATDLPFWPYWLGNSMGTDTAPAFLDAMKDVPNFSGMKYTTSDFFTFQQIRFLAEKRGMELNLVTGADEMFVCGCVMKSDGGIGSTYNVMPKMYARMYTAFHEGNLASAMQLQEQCNQVVALLIDTCACRERGTNIIAGIMAVLRSRGHDVGYPRDRMLSRPFTAEQEKTLLDGIAAMDFVVE